MESEDDSEDYMNCETKCQDKFNKCKFKAEDIYFLTLK